MLQSISSEKKLVKPLGFFGTNFQKKGLLWATPKMKNNFFGSDNKKADHQLSQTFYFIKILYVLTEL